MRSGRARGFSVKRVGGERGWHGRKWKDGRREKGGDLVGNVGPGSHVTRGVAAGVWRWATLSRCGLLERGLFESACEWVVTLAGEGSMPLAIVVGVDPGVGGRFVTEELVGWIDAEYLTLGVPEARVLIGSGFGALEAARLALGRRGRDGSPPFGKVAGLSTSFEGKAGDLPGDCEGLREIEELDALPVGVRMYFDYGTVALDECYEPYHAELGSLLRERGWRDGREFVIERVPGGAQTAGSWRKRLGPALRWLCG